MKVAVIQYTNLPAECNKIAQNLFDLTKFRLEVPCAYQFERFESSDFSTTLDQLTDFHWAVMVTTGTYFYSGDAMFDTILHGLEHNSPMVCHIIDKEGYPYAHPQWLAVNLQAWRSVGSPRFENPGTIKFQAPKAQKTFRGGFLRNKQAIRNNYKPTEIRGSSEMDTFEIGPQEFGARVIAAFLQAGYSVVNVPESVRECKFYSYPEFLYPTIERMIADPEFDDIEHESLQVFNTQLQQLRRNLSVGYYPVNTEKLLDTVEHMTLDCFAGVCGGIKPAWITGSSYFAPRSRVLLFDISAAAIDYQKHLLAHWDGSIDNLVDVVQDFQDQNPTYVSQYFKDMGLKENLWWCLHGNPDMAAEFYQRWNRYRQHDIVFEQLDLFDDNSADRILSWINQAQSGSYIWPSNSFWMDYLMFYSTADECVETELRFKKKITEKSQKLVVWDDRHSGHKLT